MKKKPKRLKLKNGIAKVLKHKSFQQKIVPNKKRTYIPPEE